MLSSRPEVPRTIADFAVLREIGRGGMGVVYEAIQADTERRVALKVVRGGQFVDEAVLRLFRREIQALARLEHPGIASLYASGRTSDGLHYFAMELVEGEPLDAWLEKRGAAPSPEELAVRLGLFLEIVDAVAYAHQRGVLHRDLKPSNLIVTADGHVKVLDFGLARITDVDVARATHVTELGTVRGTLAYMSPEQLSGNPDALDLRADVYALGVVLYEMIAGEHPFDLEEVPEFDIPRVIREEPPKSLRSRWKGTGRLDPDLATIAGKALEKDPARRYQSALALADDLRRHVAGLPILARAPSAVYQFRKLVARHKAPFAVLALILALVIAFGVSMAVFARHLADERNRANREAERANEEAHASQQAAKVLSELVRVDLSGGLFSNRTLDPKDVARVVSSIEARWPSKPQAAAELLEHVGVSLVLAGSYEAAIRFIERAIEIRRDVLHEPDWEFAGPRIALGEYYVIVGRLRDAEALFSSALARARGNASVSPVNLGYLLEDLGCVRRDLRRLAEGESLIREALALYEAAQPRWLPYVASAHDSLGTLDLARGDLAAAVLDALGELYLADGKLDRADDALRRSLSAYDASLPPNTPARATALVHLAELRRRQRRAAEARDALARAVAIRETALGPEHVETIRAAETLAGLDGGRRL